MLFFLVSMITGVSFSQDKNAIIQQRIEFISEQLENEQIDLTDVTESLIFRIDHPLNLNSATWEDLQELYLLSVAHLTPSVGTL